MVLIVGGHKVRLMSCKSKTDCTWHQVEEINIPDIGNSGCEVSDIAWSPEGGVAALCGRTWEHVYILQITADLEQSPASHIVVDKMPIPSGRYQNCCVFDKTGQVLSTAGVGGTIFLWILDEKTQWTLLREMPNLTISTVTHISWDPTSTFLCTGDTKGHVTAFHRESDDVTTRGSGNVTPGSDVMRFKERVVDLFNAQGDEVTALTCNPYYPYQPAEVAVGHSTGVLEVWDINTRQVAFSLKSHKSTVTDIAYSTINGMLLATASLDCEIHLVSLKAGKVIKRFVETSPVLCVEFVKGAQHFVFSTRDNLVTFRLNNSWSDRTTEQIPGSNLLRFHQSRAPLVESRDAFNERVPPDRAVPEEIVRNKPQLDPHKPSPLRKGDTSSKVPPSTRRISEISEILTDDSDCSFNISDILNYTNKDETPPPPTTLDRLNVHQKRSVGRLVGKPQIEENKDTDKGVLELTPEVPLMSKSRGSEGPSKMRRIAETDEDSKENNPPSEKNDTPARPNGNSNKPVARFVSSTPAVPVSSATKPPFGIPATNFERSPTPQNVTHGEGNNAISSLISSIGTDNPSVTDLSNKLKSMGPRVGESQHGDMSGMTSGISQNLLTSGTDNTTGGPVTPSRQGPSSALLGNNAELGSIMSCLQTLIADVSRLDKTLRSQARWIKTEVVRQACDTQFALEDKLKVMEERMEQRLTNIEQDIAYIKNNM